MQRSSLRFRLLAGAALSIAAALALAGFAIAQLFERHVERRVYHELETHMQQLLAALEAGKDGAISVSGTLADSRFEKPLSGLYWQLLVDGAVAGRSRSLWDQALPVPAPAKTGEAETWHVIAGPDGIDLQTLDYRVSMAAGGRERRLRILMGIDRREITAEVGRFATELAQALALLGLFLLGAVWLQVAVGLKPLEALRRSLERVSAGTEKRLTKAFPVEVTPLVSEINALLEAQERSISKARSRAGDLAHGLKTPLTILTSLGRTLRERQHTEEARDIDAQVNAMRNHVDRELARARIAAGRSAAAIPLAPAVNKMLDTMRRLPRGNSLAWQVSIASDLIVLIDRADLDELLGNLLDNARKWAVSTVRISAARRSPLEIMVEDDGPGVPEDKMTVVMERGARLDEARQGSGLGLSIVTDVAEAYGWSVSLQASSLGGLGVRIVAPDRTPSPDGDRS